MNKARRKAIEKIAKKLDELKSEFEGLRDEEQEAYDNMPEAFQESERGETAESILYNMDNVLEELESLYDDMMAIEDV